MVMVKSFYSHSNFDFSFFLNIKFLSDQRVKTKNDWSFVFFNQKNHIICVIHVLFSENVVTHEKNTSLNHIIYHEKSTITINLKSYDKENYVENQICLLIKIELVVLNLKSQLS